MSSSSSQKMPQEFSDPAAGTIGHLLYDKNTGKHFFRVYGTIHPTDGTIEYIDYELAAEDIKVVICSKNLSLYRNVTLDDTQPRNLLDFTKYR